MPVKPLVALDTNVLIDLADKNDSVLAAIEIVRERLSNPTFILPPTVIQELAFKAESGSEVSELATLALKSVRFPWGFQPGNFVAVGHGIVDRVAQKIRAEEFVPDEEVNDSLIIAESALFGVKMLVTSDSHLRNIDHGKLKLALVDSDVDAPIIISPREIMKKFGD